MVPRDRRINTPRRISDDCSQCGIWSNDITRMKQDIETHTRDTNEAVATLHHRIDKMLPRWVFILVVGLYLALSVYNTTVIKDLSVAVGKVETKIEALSPKTSHH